MKTGLLSIHEAYADEIFAGRKKYEFRRKAPQISGRTRFLIYVPGPRKELAGEMVVSRVLSAPRAAIWARTRHQAGISKDEFMTYFEGRPIAHALVIESAKRREQPLPLDEMRQSIPGGFWPPQYLQWIQPAFLRAVCA